MANILENILGALNSETLNNFISGKAKPEINVNTNVSMETETIKTMGLYIFLAFSGSFLILAFLMYWVIRWALISYKNY